MGNKWPLLKLCNNGWKLDELASITYPGYKRSYLDKEGNVKAKVKIEERETDNATTSTDPNHVNNVNENSNNDTIHTNQKRKYPKLPKSNVPEKKRKGTSASSIFSSLMCSFK